VVVSGGETRLCQTLDQSFPPACGDPSLVLEGYTPEPGTLTEAADVAWSSNEVQVLGERVGERLVVDGILASAVGIATWPAGTETGVEVVDRIVAAAGTGDPAALARLVHYRAVPCVLPDDAREGQLVCAQAEPAGTPADVMLAAHCEGFLLRSAQIESWLEGLVGEGLGLHGAYVEAAARTQERTGGTERAYVAVLAPRLEATMTVTLIIDEGGLSAVFRSCGDPPLEVREGGLIPQGAEVLLTAPD
jgi:hypothetical protein